MNEYCTFRQIENSLYISSSVICGIDRFHVINSKGKLLQQSYRESER